MDAAVAATDAGDTSTGIMMARAARRRAAALRLPVREARAYSTERAARLCQGARLRPNLAALRAIDDLGFDAMVWSSRMTEAVIAWKCGNIGLAREILAPLPIDRVPSRFALHELPVACFSVALGASCGRDRAHALARRAVREAAPPLAVQCIALLALGGDASRATLRRCLERLHLPTRGHEFTRAREFQSIKDSVAILSDC